MTRVSSEGHTHLPQRPHPGQLACFHRAKVAKSKTPLSSQGEETGISISAQSPPHPRPGLAQLLP